MPGREETSTKKLKLILVRVTSVAMTDEQFQALINRVSKMSTVPASSTPTTPPKKSEPESSQDSDLKCTFYGKDQLLLYVHKSTSNTPLRSRQFSLVLWTSPIHMCHSTSPGQPPTAQPFPIRSQNILGRLRQGRRVPRKRGNIERLHGPHQERRCDLGCSIGYVHKLHQAQIVLPLLEGRIWRMVRRNRSVKIGTTSTRHDSFFRQPD